MSLPRAAGEQGPLCSPSAPSNHPQPHHSSAGEANVKLHVCLLIGGSLGCRASPLSWGHCLFLPGLISVWSVGLSRTVLGQDCSCASGTGHVPQMQEESIHLQLSANKPLSPQHSFDGFSSLQEGGGLLAAASGWGDSGHCPHELEFSVQVPVLEAGRLNPQRSRAAAAVQLRGDVCWGPPRSLA